MIANKQQPKVVSIAHKRNYTAVTITVTHRDVKEATPHPWLSPVSRALCNSLAIDGAEVLHETIRLFREGKKDVVIATPESVQRFEYLYDLHGKGQPFNFSVNVPAQLVLHEEVA